MKINISSFLLLFMLYSAISTAQQIDSLQHITISVTFASPPGSFTVTKAPLRFNKSFAYSFQIDDGGKDIYTHGYPFFEGGAVAGTTFPGLKYTDGCGNDHFFKMSSSLFSFSTYGGGENDMHDPGSAFAPITITWPELIELYQHNWGVSNHGLTSDVTSEKEYEVARNHSYVKLKTQTATTGGIDMNIFVNPNGVEAYSPVAFSQGSLVCYRVGYTVGDPSLDVTSTWDHNQIKMGRRGVGNTASLIPLVDAMAVASAGNARHWGVHFTHAVTNGSYGYDFTTFQTAMNHVANTYGKNGFDNLWMATEEEILDYLLIKDAISINTQLTGSVLHITFSGTIPSSYKYYLHSLLVSADQPVASVTATGISNLTFNGTGTNNSLINIAWNGHYVIPPEVNAETWVSKAETTHSQYDANIAMDYVLMVPAGAVQQAFRLRLCTVTGITLPASFCNMRNAPVTSIPALNACPNSQISIPVLVVGFSNITSASIRIEYDPAMMTFVSGSAAKPAILPGMQVTQAPVGGGSALNKIMITWSGTAPKSLAGSDTLARLVFTNVMGSIPVVFNTTSGSSGDCEYKDENSNVMIDFPNSTYYLNGQVNFSGLPAPGLITGPAAICPGTTGHVYSITPVTGATSYAWTYPSGFIPATGQTASSITLSASASAISGGITVKAVNSCNNNPESPPFLITVKPALVPVITGNSVYCSATSNVSYITEPGMTNYTWAVSSGGTITSGSGTNAAIVSWNSPGIQVVSVTYTASNGCASTSPATKPITINARPVPSISGNSTGCLNGPSVFATETGMTNYNWIVSAGGSIVSGGNAPIVTVIWTNAGPQTVNVNYMNSNGCEALAPTTKPIAVAVPPGPVINGLSSACMGAANLFYYTDPGMSDYTWVVSGGGTVTGGAGTNVITVTWNIIGNETVSVNYVNPSGCTSSLPTIKNVVVNSLPVPTLTGMASVCKGTMGVAYSTEPGMSNYQWIISPGGIITSGGNTELIHVTWTTAGQQSVAVNYTQPNGCRAATPAMMLVTVKPLPNPSIIGIDTVCMNTISTYATDNGMTDYQWLVANGGIIVSGAGTSSIQVQWNAAGAKTISVNYQDTMGCSAAIPSVMAIQVFPLPIPSIAGVGMICAGSEGVNYVTENGMTNYLWTISPGGTITGGAITNMVTVNWNLPGAQSVGVVYTNGIGCSINPPFLKSVSVLPIPIPTISGYDSVCVNQFSDYLTESGMSGYQWNISAGGNITSGAGSNFIHVLWTSVGTKSVTVSYTAADGCTTTVPGAKTVLVANLTPSISGTAAVCAGDAGVTYSTQPGMLNYAWSVTQGGVITSGSGTNNVSVTWNVPGIQAVSVSYSNSFGCTASNPTNFPVTVNPLPVPTITGTSQLCMNATPSTYSTQPGMVNFNWTVSTGGIITGGQGTNAIVVNWTIPGIHSVSVNYTNSNGCTSGVPGLYPVTVSALPSAPGQVSGETEICKPKTGVVYSVAPVPNATGYLWNLPPGVIITSGANTNIVTVNYGAGALSGDIAVVGTNTCGPGPFSLPLPIGVNPYPAVAVISQISADTLFSSTSSGNQWYFDGQTIPGATNQYQQVNRSGHYFVLRNQFGCISDTSNVLYAIAVGIGIKPACDFSIYPNPGTGKITVMIKTDRTGKKLNIHLYDKLGREVFRNPDELTFGEIRKELDLGNLPNGIYTLIIKLGINQLTHKVIIAN